MFVSTPATKDGETDRETVREREREFLSSRYFLFYSPTSTSRRLLRFPRTKMNSAGRTTLGWEGRANRSRLGLFASYRVGVKINVNFAVELISPAPINPINSRSSHRLSLAFPLLLLLLPHLSIPITPSLSLSFSPRYLLRFSLSPSLYLSPSRSIRVSGPSYRRPITDISSSHAFMPP